MGKIKNAYLHLSRYSVLVVNLSRHAMMCFSDYASIYTIVLLCTSHLWIKKIGITNRHINRFKQQSSHGKGFMIYLISFCMRINCLLNETRIHKNTYKAVSIYGQVSYTRHIQIMAALNAVNEEAFKKRVYITA